MASSVARRRGTLSRAQVERFAEEWEYHSDYDKENIAYRYFPRMIATCTQLFSDLEEAVDLLEAEGKSLSTYGRLYRRVLR